MEILWLIGITLAGLAMGTLLVSKQGEQLMLEAISNKTAPQALVLCLFKNDVTPTDDFTEANVTVANFTGYADIPLTAASWTWTTGDPSYIAFAQQTFTSSAGSQNQPIYGYYVKQTTSGKYVWGERFADGPYTIVNNGDAIKVTPKLTLE